MAEELAAVTILNVPVHPLTMAKTVAVLDEKIAGKRQTFVVTANAEILMMADKDRAYQNIIAETADIVLPDGAGVVWAGRHLGYQMPERVAGYDLFLHLLALSAEKGYKVFFFGGTPGIAEIAATISQEKNKGLKIAGCLNGYFTDEDNEKILKTINDSDADILFAALGAPKQEKWLAKWRSQLKPSLLMGIGGSFDVVAGKTKRAPLWMQQASLEWLYRLLKQPSRLGRMMALPKFVLKVVFKR